MSKITDIVTALARPVAEACGCEIWDVEYVKESGGWYLRIYLDKAGGVSIEDCEAVSRALDPVLDDADPIPGSYIFEVSSAGAERELKRPSDFERFFGKTIEVRHYQPIEGAKSHVGKLIGYDNGAVIIEIDKKTARYDKAQVAQVRLRTTI
ncbi:MAG TPA: ribosome maturation factor [Clostridiales bacterium]|nr:ribosome maturation factor [Clostridiales bacterium]